ncbi:hypothetical protein [Sphingomonas sp. G-3-2-10]|uniref:hypothetical protein n=1 Tax=Sphingomonas sp. G-3-2-10 TaxID=2728838 RepID=UPI00146D9EE9|nr:hypothetical protein [Sphingomonas sp. G-3-2-10]NML07327.1 hypothetical protein [Sphingomonas sp. G-3-2-10]
MKRFIIVAGLAVAACNGPETANEAAADNGVLAAGPITNIDAVAAVNLPAGLAPVIEAAVPGMKVNEAERKEREGRVYYDVEGTKPDGSEIEIDIIEEKGAFRVVEIQRDIAWKDAPLIAQAAAKAKTGVFAPARVIESTQTDGSVIYELFKPGEPKEPAMEVRVKDGKAEVLTERWAH